VVGAEADPAVERGIDELRWPFASIDQAGAIICTNCGDPPPGENAVPAMKSGWDQAANDRAERVGAALMPSAAVPPEPHAGQTPGAKRNERRKSLVRMN
jgi:hypothetical protein